MTTFLTVLVFITACSPSQPPVLASTPSPPTSLPQQTFAPSPTSENSTPGPAQPACLSQPGQVDSGTVDSVEPPQPYLIYLPPCYTETDRRYPVLYLLHGQTYAADQWVRLGAVKALDGLIRSGEAQPFIMVFPEDRYWYTESGSGFGERVVEALIPHIDKTYRTISNREKRAIGGLSRGGGWAIRLGLSRWDLFSVIGLHSLAVLQGDGSRVERWLKAIPPDSYPTIYLDIGDNDPEREAAQQMEALFNSYGIPHEWRLYSGAHTEDYWSAHVQEYIEWYVEQWGHP